MSLTNVLGASTKPKGMANQSYSLSLVLKVFFTHHLPLS